MKIFLFSHVQSSKTSGSAFCTPFFPSLMIFLCRSNLSRSMSDISLYLLTYSGVMRLHVLERYFITCFVDHVGWMTFKIFLCYKIKTSKNSIVLPLKKRKYKVIVVSLAVLELLASLSNFCTATCSDCLQHRSQGWEDRGMDHSFRWLVCCLCPGLRLKYYPPQYP